MASRVNDSSAYVTNAAVIQAHADGYHDIWLSNASNLFWVWDGSTYVNWEPSGGNFWKNAGTTTLTGRVAILGTSRLHFGIDVNDTPAPFDRILMYGDTTYLGDEDKGFSSDNMGVSVINAKPDAGAYVDISSTSGPVSINAGLVMAITGDDVNITADNTGSGKDINITSTNGHTHITTGAAGILLDPAGPITINGDPGASGEVPISQGPGAPPIWGPQSGGGGVNTFAPNIQTGNYTAVIGDTIQVIYMRNVSTPQTLTIPLNVFPVGSFITVVQDTTAVTTVAGAAGVDIVGRLTLTEKESAVFHQRSTNAWVRLGGDEGTWTVWSPTFTGFSVNPTVVAGYMVEGKKMTIQMTTITNGTSNATTFTITNLPVAPNHNVFRLAYITNNTIPAAGRLFILDGSSTLTFNATPAAGAFTASGEKGASFELIYEID